MFKRALNTLLFVALFPFLFFIWLSHVFRATKDSVMGGKPLFVCDTCGLEAKEPSHMVFEWFKHAGCECQDSFRMIHSEPHSPFGSCRGEVPEGSTEPEFARAAPVELIAMRQAEGSAELYRFVVGNRPDLIRGGILRWAQLGRMKNRSKEK